MKHLTRIFLLIFLSSCKNTPDVNTNDPISAIETQLVLNDVQLKKLEISYCQIENKEMEQELHLTGIVEAPPQNLVTISFPLPGYLKSTQLLAGMLVKKGDVIAQIEDMGLITLQQEYLSHKEKLELLKLDYERQLALKQANANPEKQFQQAKSEYFQENILVHSLAEKLKLIGLYPDKLNSDNLQRTVPIRSPINGYVSKVLVNTGKYIQPQDALFELVNPEDLHLMLNVYEKDINQIKIGQKVMAQTTSSNEKLSGTVILVTKNLDAQRRGEIHCHFDQEYQSILPGMFLEATLKIGKGNQFVLPKTCLLRFEKKQFVFIEEKKGSFNLIEINPISEYENYLSLSEEDAKTLAGKKIINQGAFSLLAALKNKTEEE